jgi:hypothetical protein
MNAVYYGVLTVRESNAEGWPLPMGQPGQSEQLALPPRYIKICHTPDHDASTTLRINVGLGGDRRFGAPSKSAPGSRAPLSSPKGQHHKCPISCHNTPVQNDV